MQYAHIQGRKSQYLTYLATPMCKVVGGPNMDPEQIVADLMRGLGWEDADSEPPRAEGVA